MGPCCTGIVAVSVPWLPACSLISTATYLYSSVHPFLLLSPNFYPEFHALVIPSGSNMDLRNVHRWEYTYTFKTFYYTIPFTSLPPTLIARIFLLSGHGDSLEKLDRIMKAPGLGSHPVINEACVRAAVQRGWIHVEWPPRDLENESADELSAHASVRNETTSVEEREGWIGRESYESTRSEDTIGPDISLRGKTGEIIGTGMRRSEDTIIFRVGSGSHGRMIASRGKQSNHREPQAGQKSQHIGKRNEYPRARITCIAKDAVVFPPAKDSETMSTHHGSLLSPGVHHNLTSSTSLNVINTNLPALRKRKSFSFFSSKSKAKSPMSSAPAVDETKKIHPDALSFITLAFSVKKLSLLRVTIWLPWGDCFALEEDLDEAEGLRGIANRYLERILNLINRLEIVQEVEIEFILPPSAMKTLLQASSILDKDMPTLYFGTPEGLGSRPKSLSNPKAKSRKHRDKAPPELFATAYRALVDALRLRDSRGSQNRLAEDGTCTRFSFSVTDSNCSKHCDEGRPEGDVGCMEEHTEEGVTRERDLRRSKSQEERSPASNLGAMESMQEPGIKDPDSDTPPELSGAREYDLQNSGPGAYTQMVMPEKAKEKGKQKAKGKKEQKSIFDLKLNLSTPSFDFMNAFPSLFRTGSLSSSISSDADSASGSSCTTGSSSAMYPISAMSSRSEAGPSSASKPAAGPSVWKRKSKRKSPMEPNYSFDGLNATSGIHHLYLESFLPFLPACLPATLNILTNLRTLHLVNVSALAEETWVDVLEALSCAPHISEIRFERLHRIPLQALFNFLGEIKKLEVLEVDRGMGYASMENGIEYEVNVELTQLIRLRAPIDLLKYLFLYNDATVPSPPPHQTAFNFEDLEARSPRVEYSFKRADVEMRQPFPKLQSLEILARTNDTVYMTYATLEPALAPLIEVVMSEEKKRGGSPPNLKIVLDIQISPSAESQFSLDCTEFYASFAHKNDPSVSKENEVVNEGWKGIAELTVSWHPQLWDLQTKRTKSKDIDKNDIKVRTAVIKDIVGWANTIFPGLHKLTLGRPFNEDAFCTRYMSEVVGGIETGVGMPRWFGPEVGRSKEEHADRVRMRVLKRDQVVGWMVNAVLGEFRECAARFEVVVDGRSVDLWADKY